jgi:HlyD family secretion protein
VSVENPRGTLLPGMTATVEFLTGSAENTLMVPNAALRFRATPEMMAEAGVTSANGAPRTAADSAAFAARRDSLRKARAAAGGGTGGAGGGAGGGQGGAPNGAGGAGAARSRTSGGSRPGVAQLWYVNAAGKPAVMRVRTGLSDGQNTQVMGQDVKEGMQVIVGSATASASTPAATTTSPFQQQRRPGPGGPGGF